MALNNEAFKQILNVTDQLCRKRHFLFNNLFNNSTLVKLNILWLLSWNGIFRSLKNTQNIHSETSLNQNSLTLVLFSVKLGILTGFTIGFMQISILFQWNFATLMFNSINSSLGLMVGVLFNCNSRVFRLYSKKIKNTSFTGQESRW